MAQAVGPWVEWLGRAGHAAKGVVYGVLGLLALRFALGGLKTSDGRLELRAVAEELFGQVLLVLMAVGLLVYIVWRFVQAIEDPERRGNSARGLLIRGALVVSALIYVAMSYTAVAIAFGLPGGGGPDPEEREWTEWLMASTAGRCLVVVGALLLIAVGLHQFYRARKLDFMRDYMVRHMTTSERRIAKLIGRVGLSARGVAFLLVGAFLIAAVVVHDPALDHGLAHALQRLLYRPFGPWVVGAVSLGFVGYAAYCFSRAQYRYFRPA